MLSYPDKPLGGLCEPRRVRRFKVRPIPESKIVSSDGLWRDFATRWVSVSLSPSPNQLRCGRIDRCQRDRGWASCRALSAAAFNEIIRRHW